MKENSREMNFKHSGFENHDSGHFENLSARLPAVAEALEATAIKNLCRYYWDINPHATADYINYYREMWDSENNKELKA